MGRYQHNEQGMSQSGVIDEQAYCWGNYLLGNHFNDATLEITLGGVVLKALDDSVIAITGAELDFQINHHTAPLWQSIQIKSGDILSWGYGDNGVRSYLAVKDGFQSECWFNSRSVTMRENLGRKIAPSDTLVCSNTQTKANRLMNKHYLPNYNNPLVLRVLPSYQFDEFNIEQKELFFSQTYTISSANDRVACRLEGMPLPIKKSNMISEGISYGAIEIATDGLPIIMLKEAPTIGGYAK